MNVDPHPAPRHPQKAHQPSPSSPLDPFLAEVLGWIEGEVDGISLTAAPAAAAERFGWQPAFAEALLTSLQTRRLLEPFYAKGFRGRARWRLSKRGAAWLAARATATE